MNLQLGWSIVPKGCQKKRERKENRWIIFFFFGNPDRREEQRRGKKGMIGKIGFKTICILYSAQGAKISWAWRGGPRSSPYSTRWGTEPCSTRKVGRGPCEKNPSPPLQFLIDSPFLLFATFLFPNERKNNCFSAILSLSFRLNIRQFFLSNRKWNCCFLNSILFIS